MSFRRASNSAASNPVAAGLAVAVRGAFVGGAGIGAGRDGARWGNDRRWPVADEPAAGGAGNEADQREGERLWVHARFGQGFDENVPGFLPAPQARRRTSTSGPKTSASVWYPAAARDEFPAARGFAAGNDGAGDQGDGKQEQELLHARQANPVCPGLKPAPDSFPRCQNRLHRSKASCSSTEESCAAAVSIVRWCWSASMTPRGPLA